MAKEVLTAKLATRTLDRLEKYADREGISKSEAADRMVKQGLDVEESDMRLVPVRSDGGTIIEDTQEDVARLQDDIDGLSRDLDHLAGLGLWLSIALVWIGAEVAGDLPSLVAVITGLVVIMGLSFQYLRWYHG